jgi:hypothetical protein
MASNLIIYLRVSANSSWSYAISFLSTELDISRKVTSLRGADESMTTSMNFGTAALKRAQMFVSFA